MKRNNKIAIATISVFAVVVLTVSFTGFGDASPVVDDPSVADAANITTTTPNATTTTAASTATITESTTTTTTTAPTTTTTDASTTTSSATGTSAITQQTTTSTTIPSNSAVPFSLQYVSMAETSPGGEALAITGYSGKDMNLQYDLPMSFTEDGLWVTHISGVKELENFKQGLLDGYAQTISSLDEEARNYFISERSAQLEKVYSKYDSAYFQKNSLVMVFFPYQSSSFWGEVTRVTRVGNTVCIEWDGYAPKSGVVNCDIYFSYAFVEIQTNDLAGIEKWSHYKTKKYY